MFVADLRVSVGVPGGSVGGGGEAAGSAAAGATADFTGQEGQQSEGNSERLQGQVRLEYSTESSR